MAAAFTLQQVQPISSKEPRKGTSLWRGLNSALQSSRTSFSGKAGPEPGQISEICEPVLPFAALVGEPRAKLRALGRWIITEKIDR